MAVFTITVDDPHGVDTANMLPGNLHIQYAGSGYDNGGGTAYAQYHPIVNGVVDYSILYQINYTGRAGSFAYAFGISDGIAGDITSAVLTESISAGPAIQLAHMSIVLGSNTSLPGIGGVPVSASLDLTPETLLREAARLDSGVTSLTLIGAAGNDKLAGSGFADIMDGKHGADTMIGGGGDDKYFVDNAGDKVIEDAGGGNDRVLTSVNYTLTAGSHIDWFTTTDNHGTTALKLTGNEFSNKIDGNAGANILDGKVGKDTLTGHGGDDKFLFDTKLSANTNVDHIVDFSHGHDKIELQNAIFTALTHTGALATGAFFKGSHAHDADDRIIYNSSTGALSYDSDGNGSHAAVQFATLAHGLGLTHSDFVVI